MERTISKLVENPPLLVATAFSVARQFSDKPMEQAYIATELTRLAVSVTKVEDGSIKQDDLEEIAELLANQVIVMVKNTAETKLQKLPKHKKRAGKVVFNKGGIQDPPRYGTNDEFNKIMEMIYKNKKDKK